MMKLNWLSTFASLIILIIAHGAASAPPFEFTPKMFEDPEMGIQHWVFDMINLWPVWEQGIFGNGIRIRINDQGVDSHHQEFEGRFNVDASCKVYDIWYDEEQEEYAQHGTIVASLIGAAGNNGQCAVGIAPKVTFSSCVVVSAPHPDETALDGSFPAYKLDQFDISQSSFGVQTCRRPENTTYFLGKLLFTETTTACPFTYQYDAADSMQFYGKTENITHPCKACKFPSTEPDKFCAQVVNQHCLYFGEHDQDICADLLDDLVLGGECAFRPVHPTMMAAIEKGASEGRDGKGIIYVYSS